MTQSVSNDALWLKLSEVDEKLDKFLIEQKPSVPIQESAVNKPDFTGVKEEIITKINAEIVRLGRSSDSHFEVNKKNAGVINENILKTFKQVGDIRKQLAIYSESQKVSKENYFDFRLFKVRKTSFVIAILGLLVFSLTLFCMKQQNDYSLLMDEYYRQNIGIRAIQAEIDSLISNVKPDAGIKKK